MAMPVEQKPSVGRIVHFMSPDSEMMGYSDQAVPAVITRVTSDKVVNLTIFRDGMDPMPMAHVHFSEDESSGMRWFWPPRV